MLVLFGDLAGAVIALGFAFAGAVASLALFDVEASLAEIQKPIVDAYLAALPAGAAPRITASRNVFVSETPVDAAASARPEQADAHVGTPEQVIASLSADATLRHADEIAFQVPDVHTPHALILRSIELFATEVAPALGWDATAPAIERTS